MEKQKRRSRFKADPRGMGRHGEHVSGTPNQLAVLDLLLTYPCLPSNYIKARLPSGAIADVILLLSQEGYIGVPKEATMHVNPIGRPTIYELKPKGLQLLLDRGRPKRVASNEQFRHKFLTSIAQFSFDIAAREIVGLTKRTLADIEAHPDYPGGTDPDHIRPDAPLFGYEYTQPSGRKRYFYLHGFEADRGTEPLTGYGRQTIERKISHYAEYLADRVYDDVYGISNLSIAFVTISAGRAHNILDIVTKVAGEHAPKFLVKHLPDFIHEAKPPAPTGHMVTEPWLTTDGKLSILDVLKAERR
jgi:hypothetical protein